MIMTLRHTRIESKLGELTLVAEAAALTGLYFPHHWYKPSDDTFGPSVDASTDPLFREVAAQLDDYLTGARTTFDIPTATTGDPFQQRIWARLDEIPYGETVTYGDLAEELGNKALAQQVGQAVGHNPISVIVPCHRVVGKGGKLTGYAGGVTRKKLLLELEEPAQVKAGKLF
jgi:methylated-DNA-[protein]-cysteine S-methyltransferase